MDLNNIENGIRSWVKSIVRFIIDYRAVILLVVLITAIVILIIGRKSDLIGFPFDSRVWGGVSDWVMVVITLAGTIALLWTLTDQIKINKQTIQKSIREIRPYFKINFVKPTDKSSKGTCELYLDNAAAFKVSLVYIGDEPPENGLITLWETHHQQLG